MSNGVQHGPGGVPLVCIVCPGEPTFSDLSHLLTHVGSKAHLSNHFKLTVKAPRDPAVRTQLDNYDYWCDRYRINQSLAGRLASKDGKGTKGRMSAGSCGLDGASDLPPLKRQTRRATKLEPSDETADFRPSKLSTRSQPRIIDSRGQTRGRGFDYNLRGPGIPQVKITGTSDVNHSAATNEQTRGRSISSYPTKRVSPPRSASLDSVSSIASSITYTDTERAPSAEPNHIKGTVRLKGVIYPGMALFDSASEAVRKTRNQKKDGTALAAMERQSTLIHPTEMIFHGDGEFKRQRPIYGYGSDDNPTTPECSPPPKRPTRHRRRILGDIDTNNRVSNSLSDYQTKLGRPRKARKSTKVKDEKPSTIVDLANLSTEQIIALREVLGMSDLNRRDASVAKLEPVAPPSSRCSWQPSEEEKNEWRMTVNALHPARSRPFQIYEDNALPPIRDGPATHLSSHLEPMQCSQPLPSEFRHDPLGHNANYDFLSNAQKQFDSGSGQFYSHQRFITPHQAPHPTIPSLHHSHVESHGLSHFYEPEAPVNLRRLTSFDFDTSMSMNHPSGSGGAHATYPDTHPTRSSANRYHGGTFYDPFTNGIDLGYNDHSTTNSTATKSPTERLSRKAASKMMPLDEGMENIRDSVETATTPSSN